MKRHLACYLALGCCLLVAVSGADKELPVIISTTPEPQTSTVAPSTPSVKPTESTTTSPSTTTTTTTPNTTSTTTTTTTPTTSTKPVPTTTSPPPTTPTPPIPQPPQSQKYVVNVSDHNLIIAKMAMQINVTYENIDSKMNVSVQINIPHDNRTTASGSNSSMNDELLQLSWKSAGTGNNSVILHFKKDAKTYALTGVEVMVQPQELPHSKYNESVHFVFNKQAYNTTLGNSYRCIKLQTFNLTKTDESAVMAQLNVHDMQFQAFKSDNQTSFGYADDCQFDTPDVVPIAVGCVLAGLVVIVLGAYLITRKRTARGYHSM